MAEDYKELVEYLDKKFNKIDDKFNKIDDKFNKIDESFILVENKLVHLDETKADKSDINNLINSVDAYAHKADGYFQEMVMLSNKVDRHEKWIQRIAEKLDIKLEH